MNLQRRHFNLIAETIRTSGVDDDARAQIARDFSRALRETNPNFDIRRFEKACGVQEDN